MHYYGDILKRTDRNIEKDGYYLVRHVDTESKTITLMRLKEKLSFTIDHGKEKRFLKFNIKTDKEKKFVMEKFVKVADMPGDREFWAITDSPYGKEKRYLVYIRSHGERDGFGWRIKRDCGAYCLYYYNLCEYDDNETDNRKKCLQTNRAWNKWEIQQNYAKGSEVFGTVVQIHEWIKKKPKLIFVNEGGMKYYVDKKPIWECSKYSNIKF